VLARICSVKGCNRIHDAKGYCYIHYHAWRTHGNPSHIPVHVTKLCSVDKCNLKHNAKGFCNKHYSKWKRFGDPLFVVDPMKRNKAISVRQKNWHKNNKNPMQGKKHTKKTKKLQSLVAKNRPPISEATRKKLSKSPKNLTPKFLLQQQKGRKKSEKHKMNISKSLTGKKHSKERRQKQSESQKKLWTTERRKKASDKQRGKKLSKETKKKISLANKGELNSFYGKTHSNETKEYLRSKQLGKKHSEKTKKLLSDINSTPERKALQKEVFKRARKTMARPNIPEKAIGKILEGIGIKYKFLQDIHYKTLENKPASKEMDIVWKDSAGNKKIIEHNGYRHYDNRDFEPDEVVNYHNKPTKCQDIWNAEDIVLNQIKKEGYQILIIWGEDFLKKRENETKRIIEFATKT